ncbi:MAG: hypothetical protein HZC03_02325 [Candidatus Lloydbacteria bacterium]|nr:hypothetical protein [Candidatus Lloydbacteria bacterium]
MKSRLANTKPTTFFIVGIVAIFFIPRLTLAGFGVSPPQIAEDHLVRGSHLERTVYLVQGNPEVDLQMEIVVDSANIKNWISFENGKIFTIPKNTQQFPLKVIVDVPSTADLGIYKAFLRFNTVPQKEKSGSGSGSGVAVTVGGRISMELTVGEGIVKSYQIPSIGILNVSTGENPKVSLTIENTGNVPAGPSAASFELFNNFGNIRLAYGEFHSFEPVKSFSSKNITIEFPIDIRLAEGEYWGYARIYNEDNQVTKELKAGFHVRKGGLSSLIAGVGTVGMSITLGVLGAIAFFILFIVFKKRFRKR